MCHRELGPGTEYGLLIVSPLGPLRATLRGSISLITRQTLTLVTAYYCALSCPRIITSPMFSKLVCISLTTDRRSVSLMVWPWLDILKTCKWERWQIFQLALTYIKFWSSLCRVSNRGRPVCKWDIKCMDTNDQHIPRIVGTVTEQPQATQWLHRDTQSGPGVHHR